MYKCSNCQEVMEFEHRMSEVKEDCVKCQNGEGMLQRHFTSEALPLTQFVGVWDGEMCKRNKGVPK